MNITKQFTHENFKWTVLFFGYKFSRLSPNNLSLRVESELFCSLNITSVDYRQIICPSELRVACSLATNSKALGNDVCSTVFTRSANVSSVSPLYTGTDSCTMIAPPSTSSYKSKMVEKLSKFIISQCGYESNLLSGLRAWVAQ